MQLLLPVNGTFSEARSINEKGVIVGFSETTIGNPAGLKFATQWSAANGFVATHLPGEHGIAHSINNHGVVVGSTRNGNGNSQASIWNSNELTLLGGIGGTRSEALSINDSGMVVGWAESLDYFNIVNRAVSWGAMGVQDLGSLGGDSAGAFAINNAGLVVGSSSLGNHVGYNFATAWSEAGIVNLSPTPYRGSAVLAVSDSGVMSGIAIELETGYWYAASWVGGVFSRLPTTGLSNNSAAFGVNNLGQIVGFVDLWHGGRVATLWSGGQMIDLNDYLPDEWVSAGWSLGQAFDINDKGQIVGSAFHAATMTSTAFLLTPVPEPAATATFGMGLMLIWARRSRRQKS